jgi:hypothetical protein
LAPDYDETIESAPLIYDSKGDTNSITWARRGQKEDEVGTHVCWVH